MKRPAAGSALRAFSCFHCRSSRDAKLRSESTSGLQLDSMNENFRTFVKQCAPSGVQDIFMTRVINKRLLNHGIFVIGITILAQRYTCLPAVKRKISFSDKSSHVDPPPRWVYFSLLGHKDLISQIQSSITTSFQIPRTAVFISGLSFRLALSF